MMQDKISSSTKILFITVFSFILAFFSLQFPYGVLLLVILSSVAVFALQKEDKIFYLLLFLIPIDRFYFPVFYKLKYYQILLIFLVLDTFFIKIVKDKKYIRFKWNLLDKSILLLYFARVLSLLISINYVTTVKSLLLNGLFVILYFYIRNKALEIKPSRMLQFMMYSAGVFIGLGVVELILGKLGLAPLQQSEGIYVYAGRPWSVFMEPDWFGGYLTFIIALTLPFVCFRQNAEQLYKRNRLILYFALLMSLLIVVRSSWLGLLVGIVLMLFFGKETKKIVFPGLLRISGIILICLVLLCLFSPAHFRSIHDRFVSMFSHISHQYVDAAARVRLNSYEIIMDYIKEKPLQGYGAGAWEFLSKRHAYINTSLSANNILLTPIFEMGILGILVYLIFIFALFKMIAKGMKYARSDIEVRYAGGMAIAVIGTFIVAIFNDIMLTGFYWAFLAIFNSYVCDLERKNANIACRA